MVRSIQISDPHLDFYYQEGMPVDCGFPICCRDNGPKQWAYAAEDSPLSGYWGDYNCDIPHRVLDSMFEFIRDNQDTLQTKFITWVGDNSAHNVWSNTNQEVTDYTVNIAQTIQHYLNGTGIEVYPALGNHDTWPVNVQDFSKPNSNYEVNHLKEAWVTDMFLNEEEAEVFGLYGYFSKPLPFNKKAKVISLNMNTCNDQNWWLPDNRQDPGHQIQWLEDELTQIEKDGGLAYIIAHIQPQSCLHQFGIRYKALMDRF